MYNWPHYYMVQVYIGCAEKGISGWYQYSKKDCELWAQGIAGAGRCQDEEVLFTVMQVVAAAEDTVYPEW